uniref:adenylate cyclase n=1 Tax=Glossina brevipalpis TaxID=37001 RepID=A0A1A9X0W7_9MUSC
MNDIFRITDNYATLKEECVDMGLEEIYQTYVARINRNYLNTLTAIHIIITVIHSIALYSIYKEQEHYVPYEIYIYLIGAAITCLILRIYVRKMYTKKLIHIFVSWVTALIMALSDISLNMYYITKSDFIRPAYAGYVVSTVYLFLPLPGFYHSIILGLFISLVYAADFILITGTTISTEFSNVAFVVPEIFFLIGLNIIGISSCWRREVKTRLVFLSRRQNMEQTLAWRHAKDQEKNLLISIIPEAIAKKIGQEVKYRIERSKFFQNFRTLFIEPHEDVSILFADLVNFTFLTTQLDVRTLVETLHDLFQRFDKACREFNVMRIKFLGDCYYGVSGVPVSHPLHGVCCIELGRAIVGYMREVRNINIDMRIGIHSGSLMAGIIGSRKWQYDIWSTDVNIANRIESTGLPGRIHISNATLNLADDFYIYEEGTEGAKSDPILSKHNIKTFLIIKPSAKMNSSTDWLNYLQSKRDVEESVANVGNSNEIKQMVYQEIVEKANELMEQEVDNLPICKFQFCRHCFERPRRLTVEEIEEYKAKHSIGGICLKFSSWNWEFEYHTYRTGIFKHYALVSFLILVCVIAMQTTNEYIQNPAVFWIVSIIMILCNISTVIFAWRKSVFRRLCRLRLFRKYRRRSVSIMRMVRKDSMIKKLVIGCGVFAACMSTILISSYINVILCDTTILENDDSIVFIFLEEGIRTLCFNPWLTFYKYSTKVEKIKVTNWTYMAACGLSSKQDFFSETSRRGRSAAFLPQKKLTRRTVGDLSRSSGFTDQSYDTNLETNDEFRPVSSSSSLASSSPSLSSDNESNGAKPRLMRDKKVTVHVLTNFAFEFLRVIKSFNAASQQPRYLNAPPVELRIGISSGEVMAGVVGSSQAHYDIWGNAVNMAARMDTTGVPGRIQVTDETAEILRQCNVSCTYRGLVAVKGRGEIPTYFINVDDQI